MAERTDMGGLCPLCRSGDDAGPWMEQLLAENQQLLESQRALQELQQRQADLYDFTPVGLLTFSRAGVIQSLNPHAASMLSVARSDVLGRPFAPFAGDRPLFRRHLAACLRRDGSATVELDLIAVDGRRTRVELVSHRVLGAGEVQTAMVDVSARARAVAAERAARSANEAKDTFIAILSHELRAPLAPLLTAASALGHGALGPSEIPALSRIVARNAILQARLIDELLDMTRLARGKMPLTRQPFDLHQVMREVLDMFAGDIRGKRLALVVDLGATRCIVDGDTARLQQVLWNLVGNAVKFTAAGRQLGVRSWNHEGTIALEVRDSGVGFRPDASERLFAPFEQAERGAGGGLGLGLAIARGIIDLHGGKLIANSAGVGRGARFIVELTALAPSRARRTSDAPPAPAAKLKPKRGSRRTRILLVEDSQDVAHALRVLLSSEGYAIDTVASVGEALRYDLARVALVISDLGLPDGNGLSLLRKLRDRWRPRRIRAVALSGFGTARDVRASLNAGFIAHLTKPVELPHLLGTIERVLAPSEAASRRASTRSNRLPPPPTGKRAQLVERRVKLRQRRLGAIALTRR